MASYRPGLSLVATRPLLQQTNIYLSVSSFGLLLLFPKNLSSLRSFRFSGSPSFCSFGARESLIAHHNTRKHRSMRCFLYYTENFKGLERADRKNSKNIAVVIDAIVWHHTAQACRKAVALVRGSPLLPTNIKKHRVTFGAFLCPNKGREPTGFAMKPLKTFSFLGTPYLRYA